MIAHNPLRGSGRADFPHPALTSGNDAHAAQGKRMVPCSCLLEIESRNRADGLTDGISAYSVYRSLNIKYSLAPQVGLEPTTLRLTAECSAIELLRSVWRRRATY